MGCDGGTIPKRKEIVKNKERRPREERGKGSDAADRWKYCAASRLPLSKPIVAGNCGHLFSKEAVIEYLLDLKANPSKARNLREEVAPALDTIRSLKDVRELKLKDNSAWVSHTNGNLSSASQQDAIIGRWVCPITGLETNGKFRFLFSWNCGCLVSERAINQVPNDQKCIVCQKPYNEWDLVQVSPQNREDFEQNESRLSTRKLKPLLKPETHHPTPNLGAGSEPSSDRKTTSERHRVLPDSSRPSTSSQSTSKPYRDSHRESHRESHHRRPGTSSSDSPSKRHKSRA